MHDSNDDDPLFLGPVVDTEGKAADKCAARASANRWVHARLFAHGAERKQHLVEELLPEPCLLSLIPVRRLC